MLEKLQFFIDNWYIILTFVCAMILFINKIIEFIGYPTEKKVSEIKERLLSYVTIAELELGGSTGELKLAQVYDYFCSTFPYTKKWISFEKFSKLVDEVLPTMRDVLSRKYNDDIDE